MPILSEKFLKKEEVQNGDLLKIVDEGMFVESKKFTNPDGSPKKQFNITVELADGTHRSMSMNGMSRSNLKESWGSDTSKWIGQVGEVTFVDALIGGKVQKCLVLKPANLEA